MCDVGERSAVDKGGGAFQGLDQIGLKGILQQSSHSAFSLQIVSRNGLVLIGVADDDAAQSRLQIRNVGRQAQDCHNFGSNGNVETVFSGGAVGSSAQTADDVSQLSVVHIDGSSPGDPSGIDAQHVALLDVVVEHGGQQVVGCADGVEVAGKVQVDVFHGNDLGIATAGSAALDAEHGSQGGFSERHDGVLADLSQTVGEAYGCGGLAFAGRSRRNGGNEDEFAVGLVCLISQQLVVYLCLVVAVLLEILLVYASDLCDLGDLFLFALLCDLDIGLIFHAASPLLNCNRVDG